MPKTFPLKIAAADRLYYDGPCHSLVLPCLDGELGVLAGHEPATIALEAGDLIVLKTAGGGGFGPVEKRDIQQIRKEYREGLIDDAWLQAAGIHL